MSVFAVYRFCHHLFQIPLAAFGLPPHACRYTPSCSRYCEESVRRFGITKGLWLCVARIARCHPGIPPGSDPVPEK